MSGASVSFADYAHNSTSSDHSRPPHLFSFANSEDCTDSDRPLSSFVSTERLSKCDVIGREFSSIEHAEEFYFAYAKSIGFSGRRDIKRANSKGNITIRRWVCSKEGKRCKKFLNKSDRKRIAKPLTRVSCKAAFRIGFNHAKGVWVAREWIDTHTHALVPPIQVQFLRSCRNVSDADYATAFVLYHFGMKPSRIHELMAERSGGYEHVGFIRNDLGNRLYSGRRQQIIETDSETMLSMLRRKQDMDTGFYYQYTLDSENRLSDIFWCDSGMRANFHYFGDVVTFDSTYKTNAYNKPLVLFVGVNHHMRSTLFGFALLSSETEDKYIWLLRTFISAMDGKLPVSVVTDGDKAIRNAIRTVLPDASHRLCCWHLERNATTNISNPSFTSAFKDVMLDYMTEDEFQLKWDEMVARFKLNNNEWISKLYTYRHMWAETFLRHNFFGGLRSNQRCESMNAYLNQYVGGKMMLFEFVMEMDLLIARQRYKEAEDDHLSCHTCPVLVTPFHQHYEKQAASVYTRRVFNRVLEELREDGLLYISNIMSDIGRRVYDIKKFRAENRSWRVIFHESDSRVVCTCNLMQTLGIPCSHCFAVIKAENLSEIPMCMILPRWTKDAKSPKIDLQNSCGNPSLSEAVRVGSLTIACRNLIHFAAKSIDGYNDVIEVIRELTLRAQDALATDGIPGHSTKTTHGGDVIKDPLLVKSKGSSKSTFAKKQRVCGVCHQPGHTKRKCPQVGRANGKNDNDNASFNTDFISENTMNMTAAASLNFSPHEDGISRGTVDFVWSALNKFDGQFNTGLNFP
ncbi:hypothetical protein WN943_022621 [Citrus x changshan-huyou]